MFILRQKKDGSAVSGTCWWPLMSLHVDWIWNVFPWSWATSLPCPGWGKSYEKIGKNKDHKIYDGIFTIMIILLPRIIIYSRYEKIGCYHSGVLFNPSCMGLRHLKATGPRRCTKARRKVSTKIPGDDTSKLAIGYTDCISIYGMYNCIYIYVIVNITIYIYIVVNYYIYIIIYSYINVYMCICMYIFYIHTNKKRDICVSIPLKWSLLVK